MVNNLLRILLISLYIIGSFTDSIKSKIPKRRGNQLDVQFLVCTRKYVDCITYKPKDKATILNRFKVTKVLIHGWENDENSEMPQTLKQAYLKHQDVNVIIVGWGVYARTINYGYSVNMKEKLAKCVMRFLLNNIRTDNPELSIHLVGHSLGAHVCGYIGYYLRLRNFVVYRITGLDPAAPFIRVGLNAGDAFFVDIIHTTGGTIGQWEAIGHVDFYPNGGMLPQPSCTIFNPQCSHSCAWKYFAHTIKNNSRYLAKKCDSYRDFLSGDCEDSEYMGEGTTVFGQGKYYVNTKL